jgi:hypothetical protein
MLPTSIGRVNCTHAVVEDDDESERSPAADRRLRAFHLINELFSHQFATDRALRTAA